MHSGNKQQVQQAMLLNVLHVVTDTKEQSLSWGLNKL
jgi:hypothetical protein